MRSGHGLISKLKGAFSQKYLLYTNISISVGLSALGDACEQNYEILTKEIDQYDLTRTRNMSMSGLTAGVICHNWYIILDKLYPGFGLRTVLKKILVDQLVCSPLCVINMFATVGLLEGKSFKEVLDEIKTKFGTLYKAEWVVWPPAQFVNFYYLPYQYRVLFDNAVSFGYDVYYSHVKYDKHKAC